MDISGSIKDSIINFHKEINSNVNKIPLKVVVDKDAALYFAKQDSKFFSYLIFYKNNDYNFGETLYNRFNQDFIKIKLISPGLSLKLKILFFIMEKGSNFHSPI